MTEILAAAQEVAADLIAMSTTAAVASAACCSVPSLRPSCRRARFQSSSCA